MERLTNKDALQAVNELSQKVTITSEQLLIYCKLGQYEDNEEKIGIDLNTIVNLDTFYAKGDDGNIYEVHMGTTKYDNGEIVEKYIDFKNLCIHAAYFWGGTYMADKNLYFKDYGITWALTREELEYEKK